jgi:cytochrome c553
MRKGALLLLGVLAGGAVPPPGATSCSGCHGLAGSIPPIAGRPEPDLAAAMLAFRDGSRPATIMDRLMKGFSPDEIRALAAWLAAQR